MPFFVQPVIVTHNSENVLPRCLQALQEQSAKVHQIIIVDSGSQDTSYLSPFEKSEDFLVIKTRNVGFSVANNLGYQHISSLCEVVLFINPDTFLDADCVARAVETLQQHPEAGALSGKLFRFDVASGKKTDTIDSTGIFRSWYGRWHDRGQGIEDEGQYDRAEYKIPAACGAMMFCRRKALEDVSLGKNTIFDPDFFLYKEDIELCLRLRENGWQILYQPECIAGHGRGWQRQRKNIPRELRKMASANEVLLYRKHPSIYIGWALFKYALVRIFNV